LHCLTRHSADRTTIALWWGYLFMAENKKSFLLYCDLIHTIKKLPKETVADLFIIILEYVNDLNPEIKDNILLEVAFEPIKQKLKRDLRRYEAFVIKQSENGKQGGRPKKANALQEKPEKPSLLSESQKSLNDIDSVNDIDIKNNIIFEFEEFRKLYPGSKRGHKTELENLKKKHKDWKQVVQLLTPSIKQQIQQNTTLAGAGKFVPNWKNMQTWINQRCWEVEVQKDVVAPDNSKLKMEPGEYKSFW